MGVDFVASVRVTVRIRVRVGVRHGDRRKYAASPRRSFERMEVRRRLTSAKRSVELRARNCGDFTKVSHLIVIGILKRVRKGFKAGSVERWVANLRAK